MHVAVVIVGFRNAQDVAQCLVALGGSTHTDFEVVVCENGGSQAFAALTAAIPIALPGGQAVRAIQAPRNLGYAGGVNLGMAAAAADAWWVLNPDTEPEPQALAGLIARLPIHRHTAPPGIPKTQSNFNYSLSAAYRVNDRLDLQLQSERAFLPSNRPGKLYDLATTTQVVASYKLGTRFQINVGGDFADLKANQDTASPVPTVTKSQSTAWFGQFHYTPGRRITAGLNVRHEDRTADLPAFNYSDTRVTLILTAFL